MNNEISTRDYMTDEKHIYSALEKLLSEKNNNKEELENRWKKGFDAIFSFLANTISHFFVSGVKSEEISKIQSSIRRIFHKTDYIETIKKDTNLQNAFLLGYCHGVDQLTNSYERETSFLQNDSLKSVILSYKYIEPILRILDQNFEISHKELAKQIGISTSALSNLMDKVQRYQLFHFIRSGKNKYYSLAYPNGEEALKIIKEKNGISVDSYTDFLLVLLDSLRDISICDELEKDYVLKKCEKMILQYTTKPAICKKKLEDLSLLLKSERVYYTSLLFFEKTVKEKVTIFTKDLSSEKPFGSTIIENLKKNITYQWFFIENKQFNSTQQIQRVFLKQFADYGNSNSLKELMYNVQFYLIPEAEPDSLFEDVYDVVIYDENEGFVCEDETISDQTPYIRMSRDKIVKFNQYIKNTFPVKMNLQQDNK